MDRDEDDEIDITELDFALKTVNYNLITDAEMDYVHSVIKIDPDDLVWLDSLW